MRTNRGSFDQLTLRGRGGLYNGEVYVLSPGQSGTAGRSSLATFPVTTARVFRRHEESGGLRAHLDALAPEHVRFLYLGDGRLILENLSEEPVRVGVLDVTDRADADLREGPLLVRFGFGEQFVLSVPGSGDAPPSLPPAETEGEELRRIFAAMCVPEAKVAAGPPWKEPDLRLAGEKEPGLAPEHAAEPAPAVSTPPETAPRARRRRRRLSAHPAFFLSLLFHVVIVLGLFSYIKAHSILDPWSGTAEVSLAEAELEQAEAPRVPDSAEVVRKMEPSPSEQAPATLIEEEVPLEPEGDAPADASGEAAAGLVDGGTMGLVGLGSGGAGGPSGGTGSGSGPSRPPTGGGDPDGAVTRALRWLAKHQQGDGSWGGISSIAGYGPESKAKREYRVALTGLATLAFVRAGHTHKSGEFQETVREAARYLVRQEQAKGGFHPPGTPPAEREMYGNAMATMALSELYARTGLAILRTRIRREAWFIERHQVPYAGWRYRPRDLESDTSVTAWQVLALLSARSAGHKVNPAAFVGAISWLDMMTESHTFRVGYNRRGRGSVGMTAAAMAIRLLLDEKRSSLPVKGGLEILAANLPVWAPEGIEPPAGNPPDMNYWFFGTIAAAEAGGRFREDWNEALQKTLLPRQELFGDAEGSWPPPGHWSRIGGQVMSTALGALALQVSYRR